ncbi:MAG: hypothetical protein IK008_03425 [Bacteroidales bacterium]|nr:hypothetical protein [Bacteroidales bacterium]
MNKTLDNTSSWNEAAKTGAYLGGISVGCLALKELAAASGSTFLVQAAAIILWAVQFFGCILVLKNGMLSFRDRYEGVKMADTFRMGRRSALLSGLVVASAQALFIMKAPAADITALADQIAQAVPGGIDREDVDRVMDKLPVITFITQWIYCFLYGTVLSSLLSRYIFLQKLFGGNFPPRDMNTPDQQ